MTLSLLHCIIIMHQRIFLFRNKECAAYFNSLSYFRMHFVFLYEGIAPLEGAAMLAVDHRLKTVC